MPPRHACSPHSPWLLLLRRQDTLFHRRRSPGHGRGDFGPPQLRGGAQERRSRPAAAPSTNAGCTSVTRTARTTPVSASSGVRAFPLPRRRVPGKRGGDFGLPRFHGGARELGIGSLPRAPDRILSSNRPARTPAPPHPAPGPPHLSASCSWPRRRSSWPS